MITDTTTLEKLHFRQLWYASVAYHMAILYIPYNIHTILLHFACFCQIKGCVHSLELSSHIL